MTVALDANQTFAIRVPTRDRLSALTIPAVASVGGGAIHAAAMGVHNEHRQAVLVFGILAALQIGWGVAALAYERVPVVIAGIVLNGAALAGWVVAKVAGLGFIEGLGEAERVQWADGLAALLAALAVMGAAAWILSGHRLFGGTVSLIGAVLITAVSVFGMVEASEHQHAGGATALGAGHAHGATGGEHGHGATTVAAKPYDPALPIDLSGTPGVTPAQQAEAENLIANTLADLPQWRDPSVADAQGWHTIGDGVTGYEHYINRGLMKDGRILDSDHPESLVYELDRATGEKKLVAAMYLLEPGTTLDTTPDFGGNLLQWHIHNNLCFTQEAAPKVGGLTNADGTCNLPLVKGPETPMVHVWITPHKCGPFSALEGIPGGQIKEGETVLCDHAHGDRSAVHN